MPNNSKEKSAPSFKVIQSSDPKEYPRRIAFIRRDVSAAVFRKRDAEVMTFPHLIIREMMCFLIISMIIVIIAMSFDAPLEELANSSLTPNPAKAPWYFLGLQEMLHYYDPVIAGVIIPGLVVIALAIIPYFNINIRRDPLKEANFKQVRIATITLLILSSIFLFVQQKWVKEVPILKMFAIIFPKYPAYVIYFPTVIIWLIPFFLTFVESSNKIIEKLKNSSLAFWIMLWFVVLVFTLTTTGTFFRGPGWSFVWPWEPW